MDNSTAFGDSASGHDGAAAGSDLARAALEAARSQSQAKARANAGARGKVRTRRPGSDGVRRRRGWSGAGADDRDPQPLGRIASRIAGERGWSDKLAGGRVFDRWASLVGEDIAEHTTPVTLTDGELTVQAESTAWATQLRLLRRQLLQRIADGVGNGVVKRIKVQAPAAPSWRKGPRHISGRGPRDTYG
ncbi:DUF721 domain-containing protein [Allosaccharopolyspora coralli]|uniref:UPF0232 protein GIY23_00025 n=1 Tax=Allosaccharopolyspora coralli TaxID=2665642 RepID=A0A5Q3QF97_9PSEU|nr:DciA family protein [Allosaccharopolyspora coralli]QGK71914.1 DUF721 domain-containing protein [Allosaccharopolyspora coralli]